MSSSLSSSDAAAAEQALRQLSSLLSDLGSGLDPAFVQKELALLRAVGDGRGLEQHLEPSYYDGFARLVLGEGREGEGQEGEGMGEGMGVGLGVGEGKESGNEQA